MCIDLDQELIAKVNQKIQYQVRTDGEEDPILSDDKEFR